MRLCSDACCCSLLKHPSDPSIKEAPKVKQQVPALALLTPPPPPLMELLHENLGFSFFKDAFMGGKLNPDC